MEPVAILFNPTSGRGKSLKKRKKIESKFKENDIRFEWFVSESEDHLKELTRMAADNFPTIVAVGGDTTFCMVAAEVLVRDKRPVLGMVGAGSANDIARGIGNFCLDTLCRNIKSGKKRSMDVGALDISGKPERVYFLGALSLGLGVEVNLFIAERRQRFPVLAKGGDFVQLLTGIWGIQRSFSSKAVPQRIRMKIDNLETEFDFSLMVIANTPFYANGLKLVPGATPFNGKLDCFVINSQNFWQTVFIGAQVKKGQHLDREEVTVISGTSFDILSYNKFDLQYDGEVIFGVNECRVSVLSSAIQVLA